MAFALLLTATPWASASALADPPSPRCPFGGSAELMLAMDARSKETWGAGNGPVSGCIEVVVPDLSLDPENPCPDAMGSGGPRPWRYQVLGAPDPLPPAVYLAEWAWKLEYEPAGDEDCRLVGYLRTVLVSDSGQFTEEGSRGPSGQWIEQATGTYKALAVTDVEIDMGGSSAWVAGDWAALVPLTGSTL